MAEWTKYGPARFESVLDGIRKFANTRNHDSRDDARVSAMFAVLETALAVAKSQFEIEGIAAIPDGDIDTSGTPEQTDFTSARPDRPVTAYDMPHAGIARYVRMIPDDHFPAWALHVANRMVDKAVNDDVGCGVDIEAAHASVNCKMQKP